MDAVLKYRKDKFIENIDRMNTMETLLKLLSEGMKPKDIAAKLKIKTQQVYVIKSEAKKKMQLPGHVVFVKKNPIDDIKFMMQTGCVTYETETQKQEKSFLQKFKEFMGL